MIIQKLSRPYQPIFATLSACVFGDSAESYNEAWHAFIVGDKYGVEVLKNDGKAWFIEKMNACLPAYNTAVLRPRKARSASSRSSTTMNSHGSRISEQP